MPRRKPSQRAPLSVGEGIGEALRRVRPSELGKGIGDGLLRIHDAWLTEGKLAVPQRCREIVMGPIGSAEPETCGAGPYSSLNAFRNHLRNHHSVRYDGEWMGDRERSEILEDARRRAVREAMNGAHP